MYINWRTISQKQRMDRNEEKKAIEVKLTLKWYLAFLRDLFVSVRLFLVLFSFLKCVYKLSESSAITRNIENCRFHFCVLHTNYNLECMGVRVRAYWHIYSSLFIFSILNVLISLTVAFFFSSVSHIKR